MDFYLYVRHLTHVPFYPQYQPYGVARPMSHMTNKFPKLLSFPLKYSPLLSAQERDAEGLDESSSREGHEKPDMGNIRIQ